MARPTNRTRSNLSEAVRELRNRLNETQQKFANRMETAIATIARYETSRSPSGEALLKLRSIAEQNGHYDLAAIFDATYLEDALRDRQVGLVTLPQDAEGLTKSFLVARLDGPEQIELAQRFMRQLAGSEPGDAMEQIQRALSTTSARKG